MTVMADCMCLLRLGCLSVVIIAAACDTNSSTPEPSNETAIDSPVAAATPPPTPLEIRRGVCPFECCMYGEWSAGSNIAVYASEGDTIRLAFNLAAGDTFTALTGNVHGRPPGIVVVTKNVTAETGENFAMVAGDTVYLLAPAGEGYYHVRVGRSFFITKSFWASPGEKYSWFREEDISGIVVRQPVLTWWVNVRDRQQRTGWVRMDSTVHVDGADACG